VGTFALRCGSFMVGALAVVNAMGDVIDYDDRIVAGTRAADGSHLNTMKAIIEMSMEFAPPASNTTIAAVVTDAPLSRSALQTIARAASCGIVRRIAPSNTVFDGDVVFALSTADDVREHSAPELLALGTAAQMALEQAILRAARTARAS
jgi:L-aminopeptidase/D-esterase-like protein